VACAALPVIRLVLPLVGSVITVLICAWPAADSVNLLSPIRNELSLI
jgi:hypothetical protein